MNKVRFILTFLLIKNLIFLTFFCQLSVFLLILDFYFCSSEYVHDSRFVRNPRDQGLRTYIDVKRQCPNYWNLIVGGNFFFNKKKKNAHCLSSLSFFNIKKMLGY
jgi:hypothetical protein